MKSPKVHQKKGRKQIKAKLEVEEESFDDQHEMSEENSLRGLHGRSRRAGGREDRNCFPARKVARQLQSTTFSIFTRFESRGEIHSSGLPAVQRENQTAADRGHSGPEATQRLASSEGQNLREHYQPLAKLKLQIFCVINFNS